MGDDPGLRSATSRLNDGLNLLGVGRLPVPWHHDQVGEDVQTRTICLACLVRELTGGKLKA